ncbi:hypothetical protein SAMN05660330_03535 [Desulforhopalus singaporensis]|uniref:Uncharacterized protein n=1 Tax=Desulforhopalus singaporensis TaxID=91360 RepID=A0A1H0UG89_9BACT|nr:hypothetical protein SAMN05660330_03535 [Desulforhopalus singaporensis]
MKRVFAGNIPRQLNVRLPVIDKPSKLPFIIMERVYVAMHTTGDSPAILQSYTTKTNQKSISASPTTMNNHLCSVS